MRYFFFCIIFSPVIGLSHASARSTVKLESVAREDSSLMINRKKVIAAMVSDSNTYIIFYTCFWTRALPNISQNLLRAIKRGNIFNFYVKFLNRLKWIFNRMIIMNSSQKFSNTNLSTLTIPKFNIHPSFINNSVLIVSHTYNSIRQMIQLVETHESSSPSQYKPCEN